MNKPLLFIEYIPLGEREMFAAKVRAIANKLMFDPNWLMAVMYNESRLNPKAKNPNASATGLIQFIESTARMLGTSTAELSQMTATEQLKYVEKYLTYWFNKVGPFRSYIDLYLTVFLPAAVGKPDDWVFPDKYYLPNKGMDVNKDGKITIADVKQWFLQKLPKNFQTEIQKKK